MRLLELMTAAATRVRLTRTEAKEATKAVVLTLLAALQRVERVKLEGIGVLIPRPDGSFVFEGDPVSAPRRVDAPFMPKKASTMTLDAILARLEGRSYTDRWIHISESTTEVWARRAAIAAKHLRPGDVVADVGCGGMPLEQFLPADCTYLPFDVQRRDERTVVIDLNHEPRLPEFRADVIVCLGVLEHLMDPEPCLAVFRARAERLILSINPDATHPLLDKLGFLPRGLTVEMVEPWITAAGWTIRERDTASRGQMIFVCD